MVELMRGIVTAPAGTFVITVVTTSSATLSVNGVVVITVTNDFNSAVLGTFSQPTNVSLELVVKSTNVEHQASVSWTAVPIATAFNATILTSQYALPWGELVCGAYTDCAGCALDDRCSWNLTRVAVTGATTAACVVTPSTTSGDVVLASIPEACVSCGDHVGCDSCLSSSPLVCEWAPAFSATRLFQCLPRNTYTS
jgi:hypothetical protein